MSRLSALPEDTLSPELHDLMSAGKDIMGFTPNDGLIMARTPNILQAFLGLVQSIYQPGALDNDLKKLLGIMTSSASGCQYCIAHTEFGALKHGVSEEKIASIWEYPTSPLFSDAEREALDVARNAALVPNAVTDEQFERLANYFSEQQIVEIVAVISLFGFLNRWNATFKTDLESAPALATKKIHQDK